VRSNVVAIQTFHGMFHEEQYEYAIYWLS